MIVPLNSGKSGSASGQPIGLAGGVFFAARAATKPRGRCGNRAHA